MTKKTTSASPSHSSGAKLVRELVDILDDGGLVELEYATDDVNIRLSRAAVMSTVSAPVSVSAPPISPPPMSTPEADHPGMVASPMVGTAYLAPEPEAANFINIGENVKAGQTLVIIEAMKVMNPITAPNAGVIRNILIENGQPVEFGQALVIVE